MLRHPAHSWHCDPGRSRLDGNPYLGRPIDRVVRHQHVNNLGGNPRWTKPVH